MRAIHVFAFLCFSILGVGCDAISPNVFGDIVVPVAVDVNVVVCGEHNYLANDTGNGLNPDIAPAVSTCGTHYPDSYGYGCSTCQWPAAAYVSNVDGSNQVAQPLPLPDAGCWQPLSPTSATICFNDCNAAAVTGCR